MRHPVAPGAPVVVKIGSSSLTGGGSGIDPEAVRRVVGNVQAGWAAGHRTVLVTSGATAAGLPALGLAERPKDLPSLQVAASVGQGRIIAMYTDAFEKSGRPAGQILITRDVLARRGQYLNARSALQRMLAAGVVPVVNENDSVVFDELKFGDNDRLAAIVSHLVGAGMLVLLTDTPGIYTGDPLASASAELLTAVQHSDEVLDQLRTNQSRGVYGSGGIATKVVAARMAAWSGIPTVVASAAEPDVVARAIAGEEVGTWVAPRESSLSARKLWIAFGTPSEGRLSIDDGAARALAHSGRSLLAVGVTGFEGEFAPGSAVEVFHGEEPVAKGLVAMSSSDLAKALGQHTTVAGGEVIHRDDLVVLQ